MARPRSFDLDHAVATATRLFSSRGYHSTSIADLTEAIGILRGSLYQAFPDKHSLLLAALDRYRANQVDRIRAGLTRPELSGAACLRETLLSLSQEVATSGSGCLIAVLTQELLPHDGEVTGRIASHYQQLDELFEECLWRIRQEGGLAEGADVAALALMLVVALQGLRTIGRTSPSRGQLETCVDAILGFVNERSTNAPKAMAATA